jgi:hypothetical protein
MRFVLVAGLMLWSGAAMAQTAAAETETTVCRGSDCIKAVNPGAMHGLFGWMFGNPHPHYEVPTAEAREMIPDRHTTPEEHHRICLQHYLKFWKDDKGESQEEATEDANASCRM